MRIAWVLYDSLEQRTGGTIYDAEVVRGLRERGDDVDVVSIDPGDGALAQGFALTLPPVAKAALAAKAGVSLARRIEAIAPEVVVGDELCFAELAIAFRRLGRGRRVPQRVLLVHHLTAWETELTQARRRVVRAGERLAIEASDRLVATSWTTRARLVAEGVGEPIEVALPGSDRLERGRAARRGRHDERESAVQFVFLGALVPRKRILELLRAFAGGANRHARLSLLGSTTRDCAYVAEVKRAIRDLALADHVTLTGEVGEDGVALALDAADALVMPSSLEGYGIAATEAVRAGVPVIAARAQGLEEALAPCADARVFADDESSLATTMHRFAKDAALRAAMRAAAADASSRMPTWTACTERFRAALSATP